MKKFKDYLKESMTAIEYIEDAKKAAEYFNKEIYKIFSDKLFVGKALYGERLGASITYYFYHKDTPVTRHNSSVNMMFHMFLTGPATKLNPNGSPNFENYRDRNKFSIELSTYSYQLKDVGLKYRQLSGKSPMLVTKKIIDWFKKNQDVIRSMPLPKK